MIISRSEITIRTPCTWIGVRVCAVDAEFGRMAWNGMKKYYDFFRDQYLAVASTAVDERSRQLRFAFPMPSEFRWSKRSVFSTLMSRKKTTLREIEKRWHHIRIDVALLWWNTNTKQPIDDASRTPWVITHNSSVIQVTHIVRVHMDKSSIE